MSQRLAPVPYNARKAKGGALGETDLYRELGQLTKDNSRWKESIPYVASLLSHESVKIQAKALWLLGEMGLAHPESVRDAIPAIAAFMGSPEPLLKERAANALGRIGRADYQAIEPYWEDLFRLAEDNEAKVRQPLSGHPRTSPRTRPTFTPSICPSLRSSCTTGTIR